MDPDKPINTPGADNTPDQLLPPKGAVKDLSPPGEKPAAEHHPATHPPLPATNPPPAGMVVHHHAHAPQGKNKWKEYLFQFFMLFLAVFCGFLAEYQLEHTIEHQREKVYMKGLWQNLAADTAMINDHVSYAQFLAKGLDSLQQNLYADTVLRNAGPIYRQYATYLRQVSPRFNDQVIIQLRNSGNLRLVKNKEITDKISLYWSQINQLENIAEKAGERLDYSQEAAYKIFKRKYLVEQVNTADKTSSQYIAVPGARFMTASIPDLVAYANSLSRLSGTIGTFYVSNMVYQERLATELMALIEKEYHLK
jgi:hypothetical protein